MAQQYNLLLRGAIYKCKCKQNVANYNIIRQKYCARSRLVFYKNGHLFCKTVLAEQIYVYLIIILRYLCNLLTREFLISFFSTI